MSFGETNSSAPSKPGARISAALARRPGGADDLPAIVSYMVAGYPEPRHFARNLMAVAEASDLVEIGLPFSDPVADGPVIAAAARAALERGAYLPWLLEALRELPERPAAPLVLMSYLNPLLGLETGGIELTLRRLAEVGIEGLIVPDLPLEESAEVRSVADDVGLALIQLVAPTSSPARVRQLAAASRGFVYAVARTGITGRATDIDAVRAHLMRVRAASALPVAAGFGIRNAEQVAALRGVVDAVVVGTALVEQQNKGQDPARFLRGLRPQRSLER